MQHARIQSWQTSRGEEIILLLILISKVPAHENNGDDEEDVAAQVCCKCDEVTWCVVGEEDLGPLKKVTLVKGKKVRVRKELTNGVAGSPADEVD